MGNRGLDIENCGWPGRGEWEWRGSIHKFQFKTYMESPIPDSVLFQELSSDPPDYLVLNFGVWGCHSLKGYDTQPRCKNQTENFLENILESFPNQYIILLTDLKWPGGIMLRKLIRSKFFR